MARLYPCINCDAELTRGANFCDKCGSPVIQRDDETAEALCQKGAPAKLGTMLKQIDPNIIYKLKSYRSKPDEACEEEISIG